MVVVFVVVVLVVVLVLVLVLVVVLVLVGRKLLTTLQNPGPATSAVGSAQRLWWSAGGDAQASCIVRPLLGVGRLARSTDSGGARSGRLARATVL